MSEDGSQEICIGRQQRRWRKKRAAATLVATALLLRGCKWRWLQQGCGCNRRKTGQRFTRLLRGGQQRYGARDGCCCVQFVAGRDQDSWQRTIVAGCDVNKLQRKIAVGSFLPQESLLAVIKEEGSKRSLLAALGSERCMLRLKG
ncbi:hypothetical protein BHM03_00005478 [Ensete ventricosum]|uniref:Uncharacterized protein n=1 Tax=Ensete ventricosum TaxID=4639 RepID=A0A445MB69_ENSVE|nr:hypothetical protein BHM03_00005478 [Ensete ventricosum]